VVGAPALRRAEHGGGRATKASPRRLPGPRRARIRLGGGVAGADARRPQQWVGARKKEPAKMGLMAVIVRRRIIAKIPEPRSC
jgi:hypothetical protein